MDASGIRPTMATDAAARIGQSSRHGTTGQASQAASSETARAGLGPSVSSSTGLTETWMAELPLSVLRDEEAMMAEWAWRREISALSQSLDNRNGPVSASQSLDSMRSLWSMLGELSSPSTVNLWQTEVPTSPADLLQGPNPSAPSVLDFALLTSLPQNWPAHIKKLVLRNRMLSSVSDGSNVRGMRGEGLFIPTLVGSWQRGDSTDVVGGLPAGQQPRKAIRWKAESHSVPLSDGRMVHRLVIETRVDGEAVFVTLLSSRPSLSVHIETNHESLRRACETAQPLKNALEGLGWHIERWSVSSLREGED